MRLAGAWWGHLEGQNGRVLTALHPGPPAMELLQEEELIEEDDIPVRSFFPENWLWRVEEVPHSLQ